MKWDGRYKAFTLSYDDGVISDEKLLKIINDYGLKCTFNLNSGLFDDTEGWMYEGRFLVRRNASEGLDKLYRGHEIAVHGVKHLSPEVCHTQEEFDAEFATDKENLTKMFGTEPVGMAYPYGYFDDVTVERLRKAGILYARTVWDSLNFDPQQDLLRFRPTCHHKNEHVFELLDRFLDMPTDEKHPQIFYLWGHAYEFDGDDNWDRLERICEKIAGNDDIFYGTNREVLL